MAAAATQTKLSDATIQRARNAACPAFHASGRIDCDQLVEWCAANPEVLEATEAGLDRELEETLRIKADRIWREDRNAIRRKEWMPRALAGERVAAVMGPVRTILEGRLDEDELERTMKKLRALADEWKA